MAATCTQEPRACSGLFPSDSERHRLRARPWGSFSSFANACYETDVPIKLSVNLNKVALLRNSRGRANPSPEVAGAVCLDAGAHGLTLHWRADNRHTRAEDVRSLRALCDRRGAEFNLEGDDREELIALGIELGVTQFTLVPVRPGEVTSDHGWDVPRQSGLIARVVERLKARGIRTAIFMDCDPDAMRAAAATGVDRVELYTEPYAATFATPRFESELDLVRRTALAATAVGLGVNAGHDLDLRNLPALAREVPQIVEVSIGHALVADALHIGLAEAVRRYLRACEGAKPDAPTTS
jgi:pyridoxine 5-phosphate synthase